MTRSQAPPVVDPEGRPLQGARIDQITDWDDAPLTAYTTRDGGITVTYPTYSDEEGMFGVWVDSKTAKIYYDPGQDVLHNPAVVEFVSGDDIANTITYDDLPGAIDVYSATEDFGADPTGVNDSTAPLQEFFDTLCHTGGIGYLGNATPSPPGLKPTGPRYRITPPGITRATVDRAYLLEGSGRGSVLSGNSGCTFFYDAHGGDPQMFTFNAGGGKWRNIHLQYDGNNGFDGDLLRFFGPGSTAIQNVHLESISSSSRPLGVGNVNTPRTARSAIAFQNAIISSIRDCHVAGVAQGLRFQGGFANGVQVIRGSNNFTDDCGIFLGADAQAFVVDGWTAEINTLLRMGNIAHGDASSAQTYQCSFINNWAGDRSGETARPWFEDMRSFQGYNLFQGNFLGNPGSNACHFDVRTGKWLIQGNDLQGAGGGGVTYVVDDASGCDEIIFTGNDGNGQIDGFAKTAGPADYNLFGYGNSGMAGFLDEGALPSLRLGGHSSRQMGTELYASTADLVLGRGPGSAITPATSKCLIHGNGGNLWLQSWKADGTDSIKVFCGDVPTEVLRMEKGKFGAFGHGAVARQTVTGSRSGNAALASLCTALANLGWITDSTTS